MLSEGVFGRNLEQEGFQLRHDGPRVLTASHCACASRVICILSDSHPLAGRRTGNPCQKIHTQMKLRRRPNCPPWEVPPEGRPHHHHYHHHRHHHHHRHILP